MAAQESAWVGTCKRTVRKDVISVFWVISAYVFREMLFWVGRRPSQKGETECSHWRSVGKWCLCNTCWHLWDLSWEYKLCWPRTHQVSCICITEWNMFHAKCSTVATGANRNWIWLVLLQQMICHAVWQHFECYYIKSMLTYCR